MSETVNTYFALHCEPIDPAHEPQRLTPDDETRINRAEHLAAEKHDIENAIDTLRRILRTFELKKEAIELEELQMKLEAKG